MLIALTITTHADLLILPLEGLSSLFGKSICQQTVIRNLKCEIRCRRSDQRRSANRALRLVETHRVQRGTILRYAESLSIPDTFAIGYGRRWLAVFFRRATTVVQAKEAYRRCDLE